MRKQKRVNGRDEGRHCSLYMQPRRRYESGGSIRCVVVGVYRTPTRAIQSSVQSSMQQADGSSGRRQFLSGGRL